MKRALQRVLNGESYRAAAEAEGIDHADLWKAATSITGLCDEHLRTWRESWGDEFPPEWQHHLKKIGPEAPARSLRGRARLR